MTERIETCVWKQITKTDLTKIAEGNRCITLSEDKPCYVCDGRRETADRIGCKNYMEGYKRK